MTPKQPTAQEVENYISALKKIAYRQNGVDGMLTGLECAHIARAALKSPTPPAKRTESGLIEKLHNARNVVEKQFGASSEAYDAINTAIAVLNYQSIEKSYAEHERTESGDGREEFEKVAKEYEFNLKTCGGEYVDPETSAAYFGYEAGRASQRPAQKDRRFPMIEGITLDWETAKHIHAMYSKLFSNGQTLEDIARRGGFGWKEVATIIREYEQKFGAYRAV